MWPTKFRFTDILELLVIIVCVGAGAAWGLFKEFFWPLMLAFLVVLILITGAVCYLGGIYPLG